MSLLEDEKKTEEREKSVHNERAKITATYLNGTAVALLAVGVLSPAVSGRPASLSEAVYQGVVGAVCLALSALLHYGARRTLGGLR